MTRQTFGPGRTRSWGLMPRPRRQAAKICSLPDIVFPDEWLSEARRRGGGNRQDTGRLIGRVQENHTIKGSLVKRKHKSPQN